MGESQEVNCRHRALGEIDLVAHPEVTNDSEQLLERSGDDLFVGCELRMLDALERMGHRRLQRIDPISVIGGEPMQRGLEHRTAERNAFRGPQTHRKQVVLSGSHGVLEEAELPRWEARDKDVWFSRLELEEACQPLGKGRSFGSRFRYFQC